MTSTDTTPAQPNPLAGLNPQELRLAIRVIGNALLSDDAYLDLLEDRLAQRREERLSEEVVRLRTQFMQAGTELVTDYDEYTKLQGVYYGDDVPVRGGTIEIYAEAEVEEHDAAGNHVLTKKWVLVENLEQLPPSVYAAFKAEGIERNRKYYIKFLNTHPEPLEAPNDADESAEPERPTELE